MELYDGALFSMMGLENLQKEEISEENMVSVCSPKGNSEC